MLSRANSVRVLCQRAIATRTTSHVTNASNLIANLTTRKLSTTTTVPPSGGSVGGVSSGTSDPPATIPPPPPPPAIIAEAAPLNPEDIDYTGPTLNADLTPARIVEALDRHIIGQQDAKKAMAVALRNRWRRLQLSPEMREEVLPKCCLLIGSTGIGKTEIARRLSKLVDAPFIKVEATKYTEVGFHGRDVEQIIRDLLENGIQLARARQRRLIAARLSRTVEEKILDELTGKIAGPNTANAASATSSREHFRALLRQGALDNETIEVDEPTRRTQPSSLLQVDMAPERMNDVFSKIDRLFTVRQSGTNSKRRVTVSEARSLLEESESEKLLSEELVIKEAIDSVENSGIVVIDEIDKIATPAGHRHGADASSEGVQRDLLPLIEGTTVSTKFGNVDTSKILFVACGAFSQSKPSDLMAELVGRLPIRVELKPLTVEDLKNILTVPEHSLIRQQIELMATEGVKLEFTDAAIDKIAQLTAEVNKTVENIGARRLHTVIERIMQDISFNAPELSGQTITIDAVQVQGALDELMVKSDLSRFIL